MPVALKKFGLDTPLSRSAASRQNTMATALKEWGMLRRTIHTAKYLKAELVPERLTLTRPGPDGEPVVVEDTLQPHRQPVR